MGERRAPIGRTARLVKHSCGETVLTGLDGERCALTAVTDIYPLSNLGEVEAMRAGRRTYQIVFRSLDPRDQWNIKGTPASDGNVVAEHRCDEPTPAAWRRPIHPPKPRSTVDVEF